MNSELPVMPLQSLIPIKYDCAMISQKPTLPNPYTPTYKSNNNKKMIEIISSKSSSISRTPPSST